MGVRGLWSVLEPAGTVCPLSELAGQTVAVDLSGWVVEAETTAALSHAVSRPYLRNLVYRSSALLLQHTLPVFVLDGDAPQLKLAELERRGGGERPGGTERRRLRARLRRCCPLLLALGLPHLWAEGEAEAVCARLDAAGRVSGVLTEDGDALLYGARTVYRRLAAGGAGGQVTRYRADQLPLDTVQLRALALLLGCDFLPQGLPGVGRQTAELLVQRLGGADLPTALRRWCADRELQQLAGSRAARPSHCAGCRHPGTQTQHRRQGCQLCRLSVGCVNRQPQTPCPCAWHQQQEQLRRRGPELRAAQALQTAPGWQQRADQALAEFSRPVPVPPAHQQFHWAQPDPAAFLQLAETELGWSREQARQLLAPLLARWQISQPGRTGPLTPLSIQRTSRRRYVDCYLVSWQWSSELVELSTHEPRPLLETCHPELVTAYQQSRQRKPSRPARRKPAPPPGTATIEQYFRHQKPAPAGLQTGRMKEAGDSVGSPQTVGSDTSGRSERLSAADDEEEPAESGEELSGDDSALAADLSAIVDAITGTHISDSVIVISDSESDLSGAIDQGAEECGDTGAALDETCDVSAAGDPGSEGCGDSGAALGETCDISGAVDPGSEECGDTGAALDETCDFIGAVDQGSEKCGDSGAALGETCDFSGAVDQGSEECGDTGAALDDTCDVSGAVDQGSEECGDTGAALDDTCGGAEGSDLSRPRFSLGVDALLDCGESGSSDDEPDLPLVERLSARVSTL